MTFCKTVLVLMLACVLSFTFSACEREEISNLDVVDVGEDFGEVSSKAIAIHDQLISPISRGEFDDAYSILEKYYRENSWEDTDGIFLFPYYEDLTALLNMAYTDKALYHVVFQSFKTPECFLAAMVYYPFFAKQSGYIKESALVLMPETNDVSFSTSEKVEDDVLDVIYYNLPDVSAAEKRTVFMDGRSYEVILLLLNDGTYRIWDTTTEDESSYMMSVSKWRTLE